MVNNTMVLNAVFAALSDPTRRATVSRLAAGDLSVSELAADTSMALPSFLKHIRALERSGIVHTSKAGRQRMCSLRPESLAVIDDWLGAQRRIWEQSTDRLEAIVTDLDKETS